jgi:hypothetical protein
MPEITGNAKRNVRIIFEAKQKKTDVYTAVISP